MRDLAVDGVSAENEFDNSHSAFTKASFNSVFKLLNSVFQWLLEDNKFFFKLHSPGEISLESLYSSEPILFSVSKWISCSIP